jgi:hypothetical protein
MSTFPGESRDDRTGAGILRAGDQEDFIHESHSKISRGPMNRQAVSNKKRIWLQSELILLEPNSAKGIRRLLA